MTKILVLSDLHAFTPSKLTSPGARPSFLENAASSDGRANPIQQIAALLEEEDLSTDWILCPGDLADKADPDAQTFAWALLNSLQQATGARLLLSTAGNHDIDSRLKFSGFDPKGNLQGMSPPFPGIDQANAEIYWARNYNIYEEENIRLVNLNSSAFHGYQSQEKAGPAEYLHGRISERTLASLEKELRTRTFPTNLLMVHHHPIRNSSIYATDYSDMELGSKLLNMLSETTSSNWLIIHGHQHYPKLCYGQSETFAPTIFSAGSVTATLESPLAAEAANQFYHITLANDPAETRNWSPCGFVRAWHWARRREWERSPIDFNIADETGFGCRENHVTVAQEIAASVHAKAPNVVEIREILRSHPHIKYLLKSTLLKVFERLDTLNVRCVVGRNIWETNFRSVEVAQ